MTAITTRIARYFMPPQYHQSQTALRIRVSLPPDRELVNGSLIVVSRLAVALVRPADGPHKITLSWCAILRMTLTRRRSHMRANQAAGEINRDVSQLSHISLIKNRNRSPMRYY